MPELKKQEIPKKIHYCWFGRNEKSQLLLECMKSWKKFFPDYEIIEWNEDNFDVNINTYTREAYREKKWAFVSDYARLYIVYHYGGIYFDTDVEVVRDFSKLLIRYGYLGFENTSNDPNGKTVNTGLGFAAAPHDEVIKALMDDYENISFIGKNGEMDLTPCPERNTNVLKRLGLKTDGSIQRLGNLVIYPFDYFCGIDIANSHRYVTENTNTIHHYDASWKEKESLWNTVKYVYIIPLIQKKIGVKQYDKLKQFLTGKMR